MRSVSPRPILRVSPMGSSAETSREYDRREPRPQVFAFRNESRRPFAGLLRLGRLPLGQQRLPEDHEGECLSIGRSLSP